MRELIAYFTARRKAVFGLLAMAACALWLWLPQEPAFRQETLVLKSGARQWPFTVEIAETPQQKARGLMRRRTLAENAGMLFLAPEETDMPMWMKNTPLALDMLFLDNRGVIVHIARDTKPYSLDKITAGRKIRAVLEIPAGTVERRKIKIGDTVMHSAFSGHPN